MNLTISGLLKMSTAVLLIAAAAATASAQHRMPKSVAASGCVVASGGGQQIHGTVGQAIIGNAKSAVHAGFFGFWYDSDNTTVAVEALSHVPVATFELLGMYPQPARDQLTCIVKLPERGSVHFSVHGLLGRLIHHVTVRLRDPGTHRLQLSLPQLPAGIYILNAYWNEQTRTQRLAVVH